ncbi:MAG: hypothetical protein AAFP26_08585 [Planctomycetota bacterium]
MAKKTTTKKAAKKTTRKKAPARRNSGDDARATWSPPAPIPLDRVLGQSRSLGVLGDAIASGRLHHAWIFHGPSGVGKFTTALAWAAVLLDPDASPDLAGRLTVDPASPAQRLLASGQHPGLHVIVKELARFSSDDKARSSKLMTIPRAVIDERLVRPAQLRVPGGEQGGATAGKVFIIDEAELLDRSPTNATSQNAILKTLEEPAPGCVFILVTSSEDRLLPTIRSRCQRVAFTPLTRDDLAVWLDERSGLEVTPDERAWLLEAADGSPGWITRAADAGLFGWWQQLEPMLRSLDAGRVPLELGPAVAKLADDRAAAWVKQGEKQGELRSKEVANHLAAGQVFGLIATHYRRALRSGDADAAERGVRAMDAIVRAERELRSNVSLKLAADHLVAGLDAAAAGEYVF